MARNTPGSIGSFAVPRLSDPDDAVMVEAEESGYDDDEGIWVRRFRFSGKVFRNEFDPSGVPFGRLSEAREMADAALLGAFDLDWDGREPLAS